ncbi:MAG: integration host factor subunit beta [Paludibacteraceae bacterium]|nr:integration host factor subunit beta [Paludibacteraceae bacterium]
MTKAELVNNISIQTGYDKSTIMNIVESLMDNVKQSIAREENVYLRGFGTFLTKTRAAKLARNICAKTSIQVPAHKIPAFRPSDDFTVLLKDKM